MVQCFAYDCTENSYKSKEISFHRCPHPHSDEIDVKHGFPSVVQKTNLTFAMMFSAQGTIH